MRVLRFCFLLLGFSLLAEAASSKVASSKAASTRVSPSMRLAQNSLSVSPSNSTSSISNAETKADLPPQKVVKKRKLLKSGSQKAGNSANPAMKFTNDDDDESDFRNFSGSLEVSLSNSLYDLENGTKHEGIDYASSLIYKLKTGWITTQLSVSQDLNPNAEKQSVLNDSSIAYVQKPFLIYKNSSTSTVTWSPSFSMLVPLSEHSQKVTQMQTAMIASANLKVIASDLSAWRGTGIVASLNYSQNFHRFDTDVNGYPLARNSSSQGLIGFFTRGDFTLTLSQAHRIRWTYDGDTKTLFELTQDLTYSAGKDWSISLGHTNSAAALKPNNFDSNISLVSEDTSIVYLGAAYSF